MASKIYQSIALLSFLATGTTAYSAGLASVSRSRVHAAIAPSRPALVVPARAPLRIITAAADDETPSSPLGRFRAWFKKWAKIDKATLQTLGVDAFFTYGVVSNLNAAFTVALAWGTFSKASGFSPLAPGQWKGFLGTYTAIYLSLGTLLRPVRMAIAVGATPLYTKAITKVRSKLPFQATRPKLNRTLALILLSLLTNVIGTTLVIGFGAWLSGVITGVPAFPPGCKIPFIRAAAEA
jgi:hypothetical protein